MELGADLAEDAWHVMLLRRTGNVRAADADVAGNRDSFGRNFPEKEEEEADRGILPDRYVQQLDIAAIDFGGN